MYINKYSFLLSFKRILQIEDSDKSYGRNTLLKVITFFYIPIILLFILGICCCFNKSYKASIALFSVNAFLSLFCFIDSLLYTYKVDMPEKEIYIFEDGFNDRINDFLSGRLNTKVCIVLSPIFLFVAFIIHAILIAFFSKSQPKKEDNDLMLSPIINEDKK